MCYLFMVVMDVMVIDVMYLMAIHVYIIEKCKEKHEIHLDRV